MYFHFFIRFIKYTLFPELWLKMTPHLIYFDLTYFHLSLKITDIKFKVFYAAGSHCIRNSRLKPELSLYHVMMMVVVVFILVSLPRTSMALYEVSTINKIKTCLERRCG